MLDPLEALRSFISLSPVLSHVRYYPVNLPLKNVAHIWLFSVSTELYTEWYYDGLTWTIVYSYQKCWNFDLEGSVLTVVQKWHHFYI